ncbi:MAG TPA: hypothetical protein P5026_14595 [Kiritimatiellia bacterium]|nr:hypothetical protein [Kiritimatiellia bacterium]
MATPTTYVAKAQRFCRQYRSPNLSSRWSSLSSAAESAARIQGEKWSRITTDVVPQLSPHQEGAAEPDSLDCLDAYSLCAGHSESLHRAYAGCVAYRIELPADAAGLDLVAFSAHVFGDPYNVFGARLAVASSGSARPSSDWAVIREGLPAGGVEGVHYKSAVAPRTTNAEVTVAYGADETVVLEAQGGAVIQAVGRYLWVYLSLEEYAYARNGWLEGSSRLGPLFSLTFSDVIPGYPAAGSLISAGYPDLVAVLAVADASAAPSIASSDSLSPGNAWPDGDEPKYTPVHAARMRVDCGAFDTSGKVWSAYAQLIGGAPGNNQSATDPDGTLVDGRLFVHKRLTGSVGYSASQPGLAAVIRGVHADDSVVEVFASYYMMPCLEPRAAVRSIVLTNGASEMSLGGVGVRITAWFIPSPSNLSAAGARPNHCFIMTALTRLRSFWIGDAAAVSGSVANGEQPPAEYSLTASRIGSSVVLPDIIAPGEEISLRLGGSVVLGDGFLVFAPWVFDPGLLAPAPIRGATEIRGLGSLYVAGGSVAGAAKYGAGWLPGVRFE